jgi:hypothetical protein
MEHKTLGKSYWTLPIINYALIATMYCPWTISMTIQKNTNDQPEKAKTIGVTNA